MDEEEDAVTTTATGPDSSPWTLADSTVIDRLFFGSSICAPSASALPSLGRG